MNIERNRFDYGCLIEANILKQMSEEIKRNVLERIDFKNGIVQEISEDRLDV